MSEYVPFEMCPFTMAQLGGGGGVGFDVQRYVWTHTKCIQRFCKLWYFKKWEDGTFVEDCHFLLAGKTKEEYESFFKKRLEIFEEIVEKLKKETEEKKKGKWF